MIFTATKIRCEQVSIALQQQRIACDFIHGDRKQHLRDSALAAFAKPASGRVLVATDVAARGLDVQDISAVVNFDLPVAKGDTGMEQYVHRIGRTARARRAGLAVSFVNPCTDVANAQILVRLIREAGQTPPAELLAVTKQC